MNDHSLRPLEVNIPQNGRILNIGRLGYDFYEQINNFVTQDRPNDGTQLWIVQSIYTAVMNEIMRMLSDDAHIAIERIKCLPPAQDMGSIIPLLPPEAFDHIHLLCQEYGLNIYLFLKQQLNHQSNYRYLPHKAGFDYVVVQEIYVSPVYFKRVSPKDQDIMRQHQAQPHFAATPGAYLHSIERGGGVLGQMVERTVFVDDQENPVSVNIEKDEVVVFGDDARLYVKKQDPNEL